MQHSVVAAIAAIMSFSTLKPVLVALVSAIGMGLLSGIALGLPSFAAALTVEQPVLTWQRVQQALRSTKASPCAQALFRDFESFLMAQRGQVQLQFIAIANLGDDVNSLDGALRVYAIYARKQGTATDAYFKLYDDATDSSAAGDLKVLLPLFEADKESILLFPDGIPLADGIVMTSQTSSNGAGDTVSGDGPNGFLLVGAA